MKKFWILLCCLILTGCNVNYNVKIDEDLKVSENMTVTGSSELYDVYYRTSRNKVLQEFLDIYGDSLDDNNYKYELIKGENPYVNINRQYNDINEYLNSSKLFNDYFDRIDYNVNGRKIKIETVGFNPIISDDPDRFLVNNLDISINLPYVVTNHNAIEVDENTNTYHFILDDNTDDFKIILEFDSARKFNPNMKTIIKILIAFGIIIVTWIIVYYLNRHKKYKV